MTPNQKNAEEEYQRNMPKLREARDGFKQLASVKTVEEFIAVVNKFGAIGTALMDELIEKFEKDHVNKMRGW